MIKEKEKGEVKEERLTAQRRVKVFLTEVITERFSVKKSSTLRNKYTDLGQRFSYQMLCYLRRNVRM
jgi:hypothetical protein